MFFFKEIPVFFKFFFMFWIFQENSPGTSIEIPIELEASFGQNQNSEIETSEPDKIIQVEINTSQLKGD